MTPKYMLADEKFIAALVKVNKVFLHVCSTCAPSGTATKKRKLCRESLKNEIALQAQQLNDNLLGHAASVTAVMESMQDDWRKNRPPL